MCFLDFSYDLVLSILWKFQGDWVSRNIFMTFFATSLDSKSSFMVKILIKTLTRFFYKHHLYKHREPENWPKVKHHLSTSPSLKSEQCNAFLQRIKSSSYNFSQVHFMFFLQFMIHQWNQGKKERLQKAIKLTLETWKHSNRRKNSNNLFFVWWFGAVFI